MGFWSKFNLFGNNSSFEQPLQNRQLSYFQELKGEKKLQPENYLKWYKENPFVFTAINERAKGVAQAIFYIKNKDGELIQNKLTEKLNKPNQYQSRNEWLIQLATYQGIWGTGYLYLNRLRASTDFNKTPFLNLPTDKIYFGKNKQSIVNWDYDYLLKELKFEEQDIDIYYSNEANNNYSLLNKENLLPFFDTTTTSNPYYSESKLKSMRWVVSNLQNALESQNTFLSTPGGIGIVTSQSKDANGSIPLTTEEVEQLEKDIQNNHGTLNGQSNFRVTGLPVSFTSTMPKVSDLKLNETMIQMGLIVFGAYGLNKELMTAILEGSTFENQKESYKRFIQNTCQDIANSYANSIDTIYPSTEGKLVADFSHLPVMQENEKERAEVIRAKVASYNQLLNDAVIDINEYRSLIQSDLMLADNPEFGTGKKDVQELLFNSSLNLRGTVGGVQGIISINQSVSNREMSRENAIALLVEIYQFTPEQANSMVTQQNLEI